MIKIIFKNICILLLILLFIAIFIFFMRLYNEKNMEKLKKINNSSIIATSYLREFNNKNYIESNLKGVDIKKIDNGVVQGYSFKPKNSKIKDIVITFGGSNGSIDYVRSSLLSIKGYKTYSFYYFGAKNQNKELINIELKNFEKMLKYVKEDNKDIGKIILIGASKGAEMVLLLANYYPNDIDKVVLYSPSSYIWQGISKDYKNVGSSWTYNGKPLNYLKFNSAGFCSTFKFVFNIINRPIEFKIFYDGVLENNYNVNKFIIPTDKIRADIIIFTGKKDKVWNSYNMSKIIESKLNEQVKVYEYEKAGHVFFGPSVFNNILVGGEYNANVNALIDSDKKLLEFLK